MTRSRLGIAALGLALACSSCGVFGAHTDAAEFTPDLTPLVGERYANDPSDADPGLDEDLTRWWERFEDPVLETWIDALLVDNLDLASAAASVREAEARYRAARGGRAPTVDVGFRASRSRSVQPPLGSFYASILQPSVSVAWQTDLFGRLEAAERAGLATWQARAEDRLALRHSLIAQVIRQRADIAATTSRLELVREIVDSRRSTLQIVDDRYSRGVEGASAVDIHLARENLAAARAAVPPLERQLEDSMLLLDELLGRRPGTGMEDAPSRRIDLPAGEPPPAGVPVALLDRRPDLRSAAWLASASAAEVDVAVAALYPDLVITSSSGWNAAKLHDLFDAQSFFASIAGDIAMSLFAGGRLSAEVDAARARLEAQATEYAASVLQAIREVEQALLAERHLREQLDAVRVQKAEAQRAEDLARSRYGLGLESLLTVLETERRRANADDLALQLQAAIWSARVDLHLALGGDWLPAEEVEGDEGEGEDANAPQRATNQP